MKHKLSDYGINLKIVLIKCHNTSIINLTKNQVFNFRLNTFTLDILLLGIVYWSKSTGVYVSPLQGQRDLEALAGL